MIECDCDEGCSACRQPHDDTEHTLSDHYDENGEWCCDRPEGQLHDFCWYRKPTFEEKHPILNKIIQWFRCDQ